MGPWNIPWRTFLAFIVAGASAGIAFAWAAYDRRRERNGRGSSAGGGR